MTNTNQKRVSRKERKTGRRSESTKNERQNTDRVPTESDGNLKTAKTHPTKVKSRRQKPGTGHQMKRCSECFVTTITHRRLERKLPSNMEDE